MSQCVSSQLGEEIKQSIENFVIHAQFGSLGLGFFITIFSICFLNITTQRE